MAAVSHSDNSTDTDGFSITLILSGGIAAYKVLEVIRRLRDRQILIRPVLTRAGAEFVTPLTVAALANHKCYMELWSLQDEAEMGHIRLARDSDLVVIAPASADLLAKLAHGLGDDLASTLLLATDRPILAAPAMNPWMWASPATQANFRLLQSRGVRFTGPDDGGMACGETGTGRLVEPPVLIAAILQALHALRAPRPLAGRRALVTAGPTREALDPVRYLSNASSGRQGTAIAAALAEAGAAVTLVHGPMEAPVPAGLARVLPVTSTAEMLAACRSALPADVAVLTAAVADYRLAAPAESKIKKTGGALSLTLIETEDILASLSRPGPERPSLVIGFAAETGDLEARARAKRQRKGCDWILANDVSGGAIFGAEQTSLLLLTGADAAAESWPDLDKSAAARRLTERIITWFQTHAAA